MYCWDGLGGTNGLTGRGGGSCMILILVEVA